MSSFEMGQGSPSPTGDRRRPRLKIGETVSCDMTNVAGV